MGKKFEQKKEYNAIPSIIPKSIFYHDKISTGAKVFYGMLYFLARNKHEHYSNHVDPVYAKNNYFCVQLGRTSKHAVRSIQKYISELYTQKLINVEFVNGHRQLTPYFLIRSDSDIASYIPPEVVKNNDLSSSEKLSLGFLNWKTGNENGYYNTTVTEIAEKIERSRATVYRHLRSFRRGKLITTKRDGLSINIFCFNSYQEAYKAEQKRIKESEVKRKKEVDEYFERMNAPPKNPEQAAKREAASQFMHNFLAD